MLDPRVGLPSGLFSRLRFRDGRFIFRGEEHDESKVRGGMADGMEKEKAEEEEAPPANHKEVP